MAAAAKHTIQQPSQQGHGQPAQTSSVTALVLCAYVLHSVRHTRGCTYPR